MNILKTPVERFQSLPGYPFKPHVTKVGENLDMHYVDEGPREGEIVLMLHGEPSWSYLYRKMIPVFVGAGYRAIAPDLIGFGRSDKPASQADYTFQSHLDWTRDFLDALDLRAITLFCQDWGGLIGLRLLTEMPERFARVVVANTFLPTGEQKPPAAFDQWKAFSQSVPEFPTGKIINSATVSDLAPEVIAAYDAPFPDERYKAAARVFPILVPTTADDPEAIKNRAAWQALRQWTRPMLTLFSDSDPIMAGGEKVFQKLVPGTQGQPHEIIQAAGHFLQEDKGEEIAEKMVAFMQANPVQ